MTNVKKTKDLSKSEPPNLTLFMQKVLAKQTSLQFQTRKQKHIQNTIIQIHYGKQRTPYPKTKGLL
jgi:hypothetical protein